MKNLISTILAGLVISLSHSNVQAQESYQLPPSPILFCYLQKNTATKYSLVQIFSGNHEIVPSVKRANGVKKALGPNEFAVVSLNTNELKMIAKTAPNTFMNDEIIIKITNTNVLESSATVFLGKEDSTECKRK